MAFSNKNDNDGNLKGPDAGTGVKGPGSRTAIVWFLILLALILLVLFRYSPGASAEEWQESDFRRHLQSGDIVSMEAVPDSDAMLVIKGEYRLPPASDGTVADGGTAAFRTRIIKTDEVMQLINGSGAAIKVNPPSNYWNLLISLLPVVLILVVLYIMFSRQVKMAGKGAMQFGKSRARMISPDDLHVTFADIAGADEAKEEIQEVVEYLKDPLKFKLLGGKIPKGCLLTGPPGTGKTLLAKAVACEAKVPFFSISGSDFVEMFVGVGASRVRDMFDLARKNSPCLIFIDEIDAVGRSRFSGMGGGHDEREQTLNALLVEMDGLESRSDVIVLAATNRPDVLDPALLRPGRFDRQIVLELPDIEGRRKILDVHIKNIKVDDSIDLDAIARSTSGFSGADLASLCNEAALLAARHEAEAVSQGDLEEARDKVSWGRERRSRKISDRERRLTAYHEAGHALVAMNTEFGTPVHKVTIIPRGRALGLTMLVPAEDTYTRSRRELLDNMAMGMGGRVAEELFCDDISSGAAGDIEQTSHIARMMVCALGMVDKIGPILYTEMNRPMYIRADMQPGDPVSQETLREIDMAVKELVEGALNRARTILGEHRDDVVKLADALLEHETLSIAEIDKLLGRSQARDAAAQAGEGAVIAPEA